MCIWAANAVPYWILNKKKKLEILTMTFTAVILIFGPFLKPIKPFFPVMHHDGLRNKIRDSQETQLQKIRRFKLI